MMVDRMSDGALREMYNRDQIAHTQLSRPLRRSEMDRRDLLGHIDALQEDIGRTVARYNRAEAANVELAKRLDAAEERVGWAEHEARTANARADALQGALDDVRENSPLLTKAEPENVDERIETLRGELVLYAGNQNWGEDEAATVTALATAMQALILYRDDLRNAEHRKQWIVVDHTERQDQRHAEGEQATEAGDPERWDDVPRLDPLSRRQYEQWHANRNLSL